VWIFSRPIEPIFFLDWQYSGILINRELAVANQQPRQDKGTGLLLVSALQGTQAQ
jgi:hypothetical protein